MTRERSYHEMSTGITPTCREPNPAAPAETCTLHVHDEGEDHSWWFCNEPYERSESFPLLCELQRGHHGPHRTEWID